MGMAGSTPSQQPPSYAAAEAKTATPGTTVHSQPGYSAFRDRGTHYRYLPSPVEKSLDTFVKANQPKISWVYVLHVEVYYFCPVDF